MKVLLINGSPHKDGSTYTALTAVEETLKQEGIVTEIFHIGNKPIQGCIACHKCHEGTPRCAFKDIANVLLDKIDEAAGLVIGSPVYYASTNGSLSALLDRVFFAGNNFAFKPGAAIVSARRAGTTATLDQLNKYFTISNMPVVSSQYWNMVHGQAAEETVQDTEGMQTMRVLGRNMAWLLKCIEAGKKSGVAFPAQEEREWTNFIR